MVSKRPKMSGILIFRNKTKKMSGHLSTRICLFMDFNKTLVFCTGQSKFHYKSLVKMVQKPMIRHKKSGHKDGIQKFFVFVSKLSRLSIKNAPDLGTQDPSFYKL